MEHYCILNIQVLLIYLPVGSADGDAEETDDTADIDKIGHGDGGEADEGKLTNSS